MLKVFTCHCGGAGLTARDVLEEGGDPNWATREIAQGAEAVLQWLDAFPEAYKSLVAFQKLVQHLDSHRTFIIFVGYNEEYFYWVDIKDGAVESRLDAKAIVGRFA